MIMTEKELQAEQARLNHMAKMVLALSDQQGYKELMETIEREREDLVDKMVRIVLQFSDVRKRSYSTAAVTKGETAESVKNVAHEDSFDNTERYLTSLSYIAGQITFCDTILGVTDAAATQVATDSTTE